MAKKKILYIGNKLSKHGFSPSTIETLGPLLEKEGFELLYSSDLKNLAARLMAMMGSIIRHRRGTAVVLIDTYSTAAFYYAWACSRICRLLRIPYMPILHGGNLPQRIQEWPRLSRHIFGCSANNIAVSGYLGDVLAGHGYRNVVIFNNIELPLYPYQPRTAPQPRLLWVRALHQIYNPQMAVQAVADLRTIYPGIQLAMMGPDKDGSMQQCKDLAVQLGVAGNITFTGKLAKADWINRSKEYDIFINTTNFDNLPVSVIEAMALGFPVVSTNVGGIPYLVTNGENGILVNAGDTAAMVAGIRSIMEEPGLASRLSGNARATAGQYDWQVIRKKWRSVLSSFVQPDPITE